MHEDVAVGVSEGIERRRELHVAEEGRVEKAVARKGRPALIGVFQGELHALPARAADILEKAEAGDVARHVQDVVSIGGAKGTGAPIETPGKGGERELAAQTGLEAARDDLA